MVQPVPKEAIHIPTQEIGPSKGKKRSFSEIQDEESEKGPIEKKVKIEESDAAYEALKAKQVGFIARTALKVMARQKVTALVSAGKIKTGDSTYEELDKLVNSSVTTYADLEKIGVGMISCLCKDDEIQKEKEIGRLKDLLLVYDTSGIRAAWGLITANK